MLKKFKIKIVPINEVYIFKKVNVLSFIFLNKKKMIKTNINKNKNSKKYTILNISFIEVKLGLIIF